MMMSPASRSGSRCSMNSSTGGPALTMSITRRGFFNSETISSSECAPMTFVPLAAPARNSSTLATVRLKATTVKPWSFMFKMRFWPITASPMSAMSAFGSIKNTIYDFRLTVEAQPNFASLMHAKLQTRIVFEHVFQIRPVRLVHVVESIQINRDSFRRMFGQQRLDGRFQFRVVHRRRQIIHDTFFVFDFERVQKIQQQRSLSFDQPRADEAARHSFESRTRQCY